MSQIVASAIPALAGVDLPVRVGRAPADRRSSPAGSPINSRASRQLTGTVR